MSTVLRQSRTRLVCLVAVLCATPLACKSTVLPPSVTVSFRNSVIGRGKVIQLTNSSNHHLYNVSVICRGVNGSSASVKATDHLAPGEMKEVGWMEFGSWTPVSGETIEVHADNYGLPVTATIPF
jgi:hypothetical protein